MAEKHYYEQIKFTEEYLIPHFQKYITNFNKLRILEVGCAEGGFIKALADIGIQAIGIELEEGRVQTALKKVPDLNIAQGDITDPLLSEKLGKKFDLIVMRDVIEHVPNKEAAFKNLNKLVKESGFLFISFPPRFSAFAGHQQNGKTYLRFFPYLHLLPISIIRLLGRLLKERPALIENVIENYQVGLSIRKFDKLYTTYKFEKIKNDFFLFRPIFKIRFGLPTLRFPNILVAKEFMAFGCEALLQKSE